MSIPLFGLDQIVAQYAGIDLTSRWEGGDGLFEERWLDDLVEGATALIAGEGAAERRVALDRVTRRVAAALGVAGERWYASERHSLAGFAPIVGQIEGLQEWTAADKRALVELIRLRAAPLEREFALRARAHDRLRTALAGAARVQQEATR